MLRRRIPAAVLVVFTALVVAYAAAGAARSERAAAETKTIASASTSDFRVVLTATKLGDGGAPSARVTVTTSRKVAGDWRRTGGGRLVGTYFWKTVTGPRAVCRLELRTTGGVTESPRAVV